MSSKKAPLPYARRGAFVTVLAALALLLSACGSAGGHNGHNMAGMSHGDGLSTTQDGYSLDLKSAPMAGMPMPVRFAIVKNGKPVTAFQTEQTKKAHLFLIRDDLSGFEHLHPTMSGDGTWTVQVGAVEPGSYRIYVQAEPVGAEPLVLSQGITIEGKVSTTPLPAPSLTTTVDGYTVTLSGSPTNGKDLEVTITKGGKPVTDLEPYLESYAHVTAFRKGTLAFAHLHPLNKVDGLGGPTLTFMVDIAQTGTYRLFLQFMTDGALHTAAITTTVS